MLFGTTASSMKQMSWKKIQNEAARIVTGAIKLVSINNLLKETGWELLSTISTNYFSEFMHQVGIKFRF